VRQVGYLQTKYMTSF